MLSSPLAETPMSSPEVNTEIPVKPMAPAKPEAKPSLLETIRESSGGYKRMLPFLKKYRVRFFLGIAAGAGAAALTGGQAQVLRYITHHTFRESSEATAQSLKDMIWLCSLLPAIIIARSICDYFENYCMTWVSLRVLHDIRVKLFNHILNQSLDFFNKAKIGSLISRVSNDTRSAQLAITAVTDDVVTQPLTVISIIFVMLKNDWRFTLYSLCLFPLCLVPITIYGRKVRRSGKQDEARNAQLVVIMHEAFTGVRVVKSLTREGYEEERFSSSSRQMVAMGMRVRKAMQMVGPMIESMSAVGVGMGLVYVYYSHMEVSKFVTLLGCLVMLYNPVKRLSKIHVTIQKALSATTRIFEMLDTEATVKDAPDARPLAKARGDIRFENVRFKYQGGRTAALRGVTLHIEPGKQYALVGPSGSGKSTMLSLILRFYDVSKGQILVDGHDLRSVTQKSLRENISIVTQDTFLFHESIYTNILYGKLDATKEEVHKAARQAYAHDFILEQAQGYDTVIGDKGCMLSGGQQQRLSIARALLKNAPILLLDEATSALDAESEKQIQLALEQLAAGRTTIAIAHRLSTILKADQIVVMDQGQIKDIGTHHELYERSPHYRRVYDLQFHRHEQAEDTFEVVPVIAS
jgi:subfamily B ATP-binding cassette protein MsbA